MKKIEKSSSIKSSSKKNAVSGQLQSAMIIDKLPGHFLILCLVLAFVALLYVIWPFITVIFIGAVLTIAFYPFYKRVLKAFRGWSRLASAATLLVVVLLILIPLSVFVLMLAGEAFDTYQIIQAKVNSGVFDRYLEWGDGFFANLKEQVSPVIDLDSIDIKSNIVSAAQSLSSFLVSQTASLVKGISSILIGIIVMLFAMYYFFKDGKKIVEKIGLLSPLPVVYEEELFTKINSMVRAVVFGVFLTAFTQGLVGGVGFAIAGISNPVFWATAIAFFSLVPVVGTAVVWVPASIILAILGEYGAALFLFLWGMFAIGAVDNFLRPYLIGGKAKTYPLLTFLVVLGGVLMMGLKGIVVGPIILIILMSFIHIYEAEYRRVLKK